MAGGTPFDPDAYGNSFLVPQSNTGQRMQIGFSSKSGFSTSFNDGAPVMTATEPGASGGTADFWSEFDGSSETWDADDANDGNSVNNTDYPLSSLQSLTPQQMGWLEKVQNYSPWNDVFSMENQETTLVVDIPFENRYLFIPWALGYAWVDSSGLLNRINPIQHPYYPWMRAARIAHIGIRYQGSKLFTQDSSSVNSTAGNSTASIGTARYKLARFTIGFANYPWNFIEDSELVGTSASAEWARNTYWEEQPTAQMLAAEGGASTLGFPFNLQPTLPDAPPQNTAFRAAFGIIVPQIRYVLHWKWVPYDYVFANRIPANLYAAIMKLNDTTAFGCFPPGTLLFEPPKIQKYVYPIRTAGLVSYLCDIQIPMTYMDPPKGIADDSGLPGATLHGHNLVPWRIDGLWYPATRSDNWPTGGPPYSMDTTNDGLFQFTDWTQMFVQPLGA